MGVPPLEIVRMESACEGIPPEIAQSQQCTEGDTPHTCADSPLLCVEPVGEDPLGSREMEFRVPLGVVGLLEDGDVVGTPLLEEPVLLGVHGVYLDPYRGKVLGGLLHAHPDVIHVGPCPGLPGEDEDLLQSRLRDGCHLDVHLVSCEAGPPDLVVDVETAVDAVILTVVGCVDGCEHADGVAEMLPGLLPRPDCDLLEHVACGR